MRYALLLLLFPSLSFGASTRTGLESEFGGGNVNLDDTATWTGSSHTFTTDIAIQGNVNFASGSAVSPALRFSGNPDTGIYSAAADKVNISVNGADALVVQDFGTIIHKGAMYMKRSPSAGDYSAIGTGNNNLYIGTSAGWLNGTEIWGKSTKVMWAKPTNGESEFNGPAGFISSVTVLATGVSQISLETSSGVLIQAGTVEFGGSPTTGGNAGTDLCIDASNRICACGSCE